MWVLVAVVAAAIVALLLVNLTAGTKKVEQPVPSRYAADDPQFARDMDGLLAPGLKHGNLVHAFQNGCRIFPAMLDAIRLAERTINFETYIYWSGSIGLEFAEALAAKARAGVAVHVLIDWLGSQKMDASLLQLMQDAGVKLERYRPLRWYNLGRLNHRTHRKLLVVDGKVGFTGGVGIADPWLGDAEDAEHWRDSHYQLEGPAVAQMQGAFMDNWSETRGEVLHGSEYFPPLDTAGRSLAHVFHSSPGEGSASVRLMYLLALAAARHSIRISASYFVPDSLVVRMLTDACRRGVAVEVILPGRHIDQTLVRHASRARWGRLLEAGVEIWEYQPTMYHCKVTVVDDVWVSVGSTNFDNRSFRLNDEANLNVFDAAFAAEQSKTFEQDKIRSRRVTLEAWRRRPLKERIKDRLAELLRSQL
jgi:cardiolipin synthase A/B